jgi:hypothetical protein
MTGIETGFAVLCMGAVVIINIAAAVWPMRYCLSCLERMEL